MPAALAADVTASAAQEGRIAFQRTVKYDFEVPETAERGEEERERPPVRTAERRRSSSTSRGDRERFLVSWIDLEGGAIADTRPAHTRWSQRSF